VAVLRRLVVAAASLLVVASGAGAAVANGGLPVAPPTTPVSVRPATGIGTLGAGHRVLRFTGALNNDTPVPLVSNPDPLVCATHCYEYSFVDHAAGAPMLVAVKSTITGPGGSFDDDEGYDLYVYGPAGKLVGDANGIGANGQAAEVAHPTAGRYTVVVTIVYAYDENAKYLGQVRLMRGASWQPRRATCHIKVSGHSGCYELPRLRALPPYDLTTTGIPPIASTPLGFPFPMNVPTPTSCYADETIGLDNTTVTNATDPILRCLRFTTDIGNVGAGPLDATIPLAATSATGKAEVGYIPGQCQARQVVQRKDGRSVSRAAGSCEFHVEHAHFHYDGLLMYGLYRVGRHGLPHGKVIGASKASFCLTDDDYFGYGSRRINGARNNVGQPDCNAPRSVAVPDPGKNATGTFVQEGMTPGWGDVYTWDTPGQFIDVTHVKSGDYDIVEETNPNSQILVAGPAHTCAVTRVHLSVGAVDDTVKPLGARSSIPCPGGI
jgi:hypothetical protein